MKRVGWLAGLALILASAPALAAPSRDALARDVERAESLRAVKNLQYAYAQYAQFGLWNEMGSLFAGKAVLDAGDDHVAGKTAIAAFLTKRYGAGRQGLATGAVHTVLIAAPVVNLSADGKTAQGRWDGMFLQGDGKGSASLEGGVYENDYVREGGVWKIAHLHFYPQYEGPYETGWTNAGGKDLPIVPYHYDGDTAGLPIPAPVGDPPMTKATLAQLEERIRVLNDEGEVRNLQAAYNYYVDRKMWDDVTDLFARDGMVEIGGLADIHEGRKGRAPGHGAHGALPSASPTVSLNDHLLFDDTAQVLARRAGGARAWLRCSGSWWETPTRARRTGRSMSSWAASSRTAGCGRCARCASSPCCAATTARAGARVPAARTGSSPPSTHPTPSPAESCRASGRQAVGKAETDLTGRITAGLPVRPVGAGQARLADDARRLAVATAYDGAENLNSAYGHLIDDFQWKDMAKLFGKHGAKEVPFAGYYAGYERIAQSVFLEYGDTQVTGRAGIAFHWLIQPVILVASDGRSASARGYLFHPDTAKAPGSADIFGAMYPDNQFVLEDGTWRIWNLSLDEPYFSMPGGWKGGWSAKPKPRAAPVPTPASLAPRPGAPVRYIGAALVNKFEPDVRITVLGVREEHYQGGTGETWAWPQILPMWWNYRNLVSGRTPENFLPDCVPCDFNPDLSMARHGYLLPPTGP